MLKLIVRRLLLIVPILLIVTFGVFLLTSLAPGDPARAIGGPEATPEQLQEITVKYHLDEPAVVQYGYWLGRAVKFDFGSSRITGTPVSSEIGTRLPITLNVVIGAALVGILLGVPFGLISGIRPGRFGDRFGRLVSTLGMAIPGFLLAIVLIILLGVQRKILPVAGYIAFTESPYEWFRHLLLPAITLGFVLAAIMTRQLRASLLDTLNSNYVRAAWARGGSVLNVVGKHALKNSAIPAVTVFGFQIAALLGGTVIIEQIFGIPAIGQMLISSIQSQDIPVVQALTVMFVLCQIGFSLLVDLTYGFLNPKLRAE